MRPALSSTSTPNELMRRCLLRWQSERHSPAHRPPCRHLSGFSFNSRILLANSEVPKFVYPTCLLGRQKSLGNLRKKKYYQNFEVDSPTVSEGFPRHLPNSLWKKV